MNALAQSGAFWVALILGLLIVYILPSLIAAIRGAESLGWIIVINLLPSGAGWPAAMVLALGMPGRKPPRVCHPPPAHDRGRYCPPPETRRAVAAIVGGIARADERRRLRESGRTT